ncbi:NEDD8-activating enzyme E1 regulatory subunit [Platanthera guangdongensis]|uniref:NEDD8-activating enzyme E1 regulatory subunit n=1 Tax=Platanthera guangdongensis TaxID=2320717 RepID=A0ABR2MUC9_9ASPA
MSFLSKLNRSKTSRSQLHQIINDSAVEVNSASSYFWILVAALKERVIPFNVKSLQRAKAIDSNKWTELKHRPKEDRNERGTEFIENEGAGEPPLEGSLPDMTSLTEFYVSLQKIYQAKAESDCRVMEHHVRTILNRIGREPDSISKSIIKNFCRNARKLTESKFLLAPPALLTRESSASPVHHSLPPGQADSSLSPPAPSVINCNKRDKDHQMRAR